ncbi:ADP-ribosyltransferase [Nocardia sp. NPDC047038]|uniref:ADP-ribosyltransferase n=1 Tax=Nocardia sp. NPDC047038 TaxID=3154338 RepID=UPI0033D2F4EF
MKKVLKQALKDVITGLKGTTEQPGIPQASKAISKQLNEFGDSSSEAANRIAGADAHSAREILGSNTAMGAFETAEITAARAGGPEPVIQPNSLLTHTEHLELRNYTSEGYMELNKALREGTVTPAQQARIDAINHALTKLPRYEGNVYRGAEIGPKISAKYQPGQVVTEDAFTSTTSKPRSAFYGNVRFNILSRSGRSVKEYSRFPSEEEILFPSGSKFKVLRRTESRDSDTPLEIDMINLDKAATDE